MQLKIVVTAFFILASFTPPKTVQDNAKRGLELRAKFGRGGTMVGVARARDLSNGKDIPLETINRMVSYFARHEVDKKGDGWGVDSAGYVAWLLWGGDEGREWAENIANESTAKAGARHSIADNEIIQSIIALAMRLGGKPPMNAEDEQRSIDRATAIVSGAYLDSDGNPERLPRAALNEFVDRFWSNGAKNDDGTPVTVDFAHMGMSAKNKQRPDDERPLLLGEVDALAVVNDHLVASWQWYDDEAGDVIRSKMSNATFSLHFAGTKADGENYAKINRLNSIAILPADMPAAYPFTKFVE